MNDAYYWLVNARDAIERDYTHSRERSLALTKLDELEMWLFRAPTPSEAAPDVPTAEPPAPVAVAEPCYLETPAVVTARQLAMEVARRYNAFSVADVQRHIAANGAPVAPKAVGGLLKGLVSRGHLVKLGYKVEDVDLKGHVKNYDALSLAAL